MTLTAISTRDINVAGPGPVSQSLQNQFISLAQPYQNCTQHIQIGTMNVYQGAVQPTEGAIAKKRRQIIDSDTDSD